MKILASSGSTLEKSIGFSRACRIGSTIAVAGTAPIDKDGNTASTGDVYGQTERCLEISVNAINEVGGSVGDVIRTRIMLTDITTWELAAKAHGGVFSDIRPACTFVAVKGFINDDWLGETEIDCVVENL